MKKKRFSRKAQAESRLVNTILIIIFLGAVLFFGPKIYVWIQGEAKLDVCKFTVGAKDFTKVASFSFIRENCPPNFILVKDNMILKDNKPIPFKYKYLDSKGREQTAMVEDINDLPLGTRHQAFEEFFYKTIADEMVTCWDKFGKGADIFEANLVTDKKNCAKCSIIAFDNSAIFSGMAFNNLYGYMDTHYHSSKIASSSSGMNLTYNQYLRMDAIADYKKVNTLITGGYDVIDYIEYYKPGDFAFYNGYSITPDMTSTYEIMYFIWSSADDDKILDALSMHEKDVPAHVFLVKTKQVTTFLCETLMN